MFDALWPTKTVGRVHFQDAQEPSLATSTPITVVSVRACSDNCWDQVPYAWARCSTFSTEQLDRWRLLPQHHLIAASCHWLSGNL